MMDPRERARGTDHTDRSLGGVREPFAILEELVSCDLSAFIRGNRVARAVRVMGGCWSSWSRFSCSLPVLIDL